MRSATNWQTSGDSGGRARASARGVVLHCAEQGARQEELEKAAVGEAVVAVRRAGQEGGGAQLDVEIDRVAAVADLGAIDEGGEVAVVDLLAFAAPQFEGQGFEDAAQFVAAALAFGGADGRVVEPGVGVFEVERAGADGAATADRRGREPMMISMSWGRSARLLRL
jgi:hypothetical protein